MSTTSRKILFFILLVAMAYVSYAYMIKPANTHLTEAKTKVDQKQAKLRELERACASAEDLSAQLAKVEEAIQVFESKLPSESEIETILSDITIIAQKHGLESKKIRTLQIQERHGCYEQPLEMELGGNFNSYYSFLLEMEKLDRITKITELTLNKLSKSEGHTQARFVLSIFFQNSRS
ncbi:MAG: type 4a pilus biogenesis protein PilO [Sedimentisphaerales bacterium]|nr:type 4a pilus biogenesis protein PilO [Sedimentisphaerales bacterium]